MNPLTNVKNIKKLSEQELKRPNQKSSWHDQYRDSAWLFVGGLPYDLTEGDIICVFSQYGEVVNINLIRDKKTGKSKGYCFLCYEDQRSTNLAVDNFNSIKLCGRVIRVDHVSDYKPPKDSEQLTDETRKLFDEGCAPKHQSSEDEEVLQIPVKKIKKEKKEKTKKQKQKKKKVKKEVQSEASDSDESDSDSDSSAPPKRKTKKRGKHQKKNQRRTKSSSDETSSESSSTSDSSSDSSDDGDSDTCAKNYKKDRKRRKVSLDLNSKRKQSQSDSKELGRLNHSRSDSCDNARTLSRQSDKEKFSSRPPERRIEPPYEREWDRGKEKLMFNDDNYRKDTYRSRDSDRQGNRYNTEEKWQDRSRDRSDNGRDRYSRRERVDDRYRNDRREYRDRDRDRQRRVT